MPAQLEKRCAPRMVSSLGTCRTSAPPRPSRRQPGRGADLAELARDLAPGLAGVLAHVDLAEQAERDDASGVGRMCGQAPYGRVGPRGQGKAPPALPTVVRAEHAARLASGRLTAPGEEYARLVGLHRDAASVGQRPQRLHPDRRPRLTSIVAPEQLAVRAGVDAGRVGGREDHVVDVEVVEAIDDLRPRVAAVQTAEDAVDLDSSPYRSIGRIDEHASDERLADGAFGRGPDVEWLPG